MTAMKTNLFFCLTIALGIVQLPLNALAATLVYVNDFTSSGFDYQDPAYSLNTTAGTLSLNSLNNNNNFVASNQFSNASNTSFTLETTFRVTNAYTGTFSFTVGFGAFGINTDYASGLLADWSMSETGTLRLYNFQTSSLIASTSVDANPGDPGRSIVLNTVYILRLDVTHTSENLYDLSLGVFAADGVTQIGTSVTANNYAAPTEPLDGYHFGLRQRIGGSGQQVVFEEFSAVPEPGSAFLLLGGVFALALRRFAFASRK